MNNLVLLESPYAGDIEANLSYARACMHDCLLRGEFPFASHLLYTQEGILDDTIPSERTLGINAGFAWGSLASKTVCYTDFGITKGMYLGLLDANDSKRPIEFRKLYGNGECMLENIEKDL